MPPAPDARRDQTWQEQPHRRSPPAAVQALIDAYATGSSPEQIAAGLPLTAPDVRKILRDRGVQLRAQDTPRTRAAAKTPPPPGPQPAAAEQARDQAAGSTPVDLGENDPRAYIRIAWRVAALIQDGRLPAGSPAPTITTLARESGHSRITCGKALHKLQEAGLLLRYPGLGYYVTSQARPRAQDPAGSPANENHNTAAPAASPQIPSVTVPDPGTGQRHCIPSGTPPADGCDLPPQAVFRSPEPQPASHVLPGSPDQHERDQEIAMENIFELPGAWQPGQDHLYWLVTPVGASSADAAQALTLHYQDLTRAAGLTPVPPRWLHVAIGHAGVAGDLTAREQARLAGIVRDKAGQLPAFTMTAGPAEMTPRGIACRVTPPAPLQHLETLTAAALQATGHRFPAPPAVIAPPHLVLAHATSTGATSPPAQQPAPPAGKIRIRVSELRLVKARHDGSQITWRPVETITLGTPRNRFAGSPARRPSQPPRTRQKGQPGHGRRT
jgi:DNA-binding transcriptional regulator YhcF (GntR family)